MTTDNRERTAPRM